MHASPFLPPHLHAAPVAVASVDLQGRVVDVNPALLAAAGYTLEELRGRPFAEFIEREPHAGVSKFDALASGSIDAYRVERRYRSRTGELREVELAVSLVRDAEGQPASCLAVLQDVTLHRMALREAARRTAELEAVIQSIPAAVYIGDAVGVKMANKVALDQLGFESMHELTREFAEITRTIQVRDARTGETLPVESLPFVRALAGERVQGDVIVRHLRTGEDRVQRVTAAPISLEGRTVGAVAVNLDITEQVRADAERLRVGREREQLLVDARRAHREAEETSRVRDEFLAVLSHELRTPLNAVLGWTRILRSRPSGDQYDHALSVIERNARAQARLIDDLLDLSRIITGKIRLFIEPVDLPSIVRDAVETVRPAAEAKQIHVQVHIEAALPRVAADPARLQQVLWNLLSNAVKFTQAGGEVSVSLSATAEAVEGRVADTGIGIAADLLPFVFDRFMQADSSTTRAHSGLGLGLAIVRHLIELHGGTVHAESAGPGHGSTFGFRLPRAR